MKRYIAALALTLAAQCTYTTLAQGLAAEITVDRTAEAPLPSASPLPSVFPSFPSMPRPSLDISPVRYAHVSDFAPEGGALPLPVFTGLTLSDSLPGYALLGYFPAYNLKARLAYRLYSDEATRFDAGAGFDGHSYHFSGADDIRHRVSDNNGGLYLRMMHDFGNGWLGGVSGAYRHTSLTMPGCAGLSRNSHINAADAELAVSNRRLADFKARMRYEFTGVADSVCANMLRKLPGASDSRIVLDASVGVPVSRSHDVSLDFGAGLDYLHSSGCSAVSMDRAETTDQAIVRLNPALRYDGRHFLAKLGVRTDIGLNSPQSAFHMAPDVMLSWIPSGRFAIFATASGGEEFRTLRWMYGQTPFSLGAMAPFRTFVPLDSRFGFNVRPLADFTVELYGGYVAARRLPVFSIDLYGLRPAGYTACNLAGWNIGAGLRYDFGRTGHAEAEARHYGKGDPASADLARTVISVTLALSPMENLDISAGYTFRSGRRYLFGAYEGCLSNVSDLSLGASYAVTRQLSVFLTFDNILCRRHDILPGLRSRSLHGLAGVSYRF
ncbi:MAG: hypothetical protein K2J38_03775 [Muribaculaceae bacterium]|nr:hypothetical protein [Muribaculaceae bacterium]